MKKLIPADIIEQRIYLIRGHKVMLDRDLAALYEVQTSHLNRAVKRNKNRFPSDFMFQLSAEETEVLICQIGISNQPDLGGRRSRPYVFTEQGVAMLSGVLHTERAIDVNVAIMRTFVRLRRLLSGNREFAEKLRQLEERLGVQDEKIVSILDAIHQLMDPPEPKRQRIGFTGALRSQKRWW